MIEPDEGARRAALELARGLTEFWHVRLGTALLGHYLLGSLAHGGFNRRYSDIDLAVVTDDGVADSMIESMRDAAAALAPEIAPKLSLFWADRSFTTGRFPPLDRVDYIDNGVALTERERVDPERPSRAAIRAWLRGSPFQNWSQRAAHFAALDRLHPEDHKPYLRAQLYPARFVYSWMTGRMGSNDDAVAFLTEQPLPGLDLDLVSSALACRHAAADPDALFEDRARLPGQVAACTKLIAG